MKNDNNLRYNKRNPEEMQYEINQMRQIANKNKTICKEKERFFFLSQDKALLKAQTSAFQVTDDKVSTGDLQPLKKGYMAHLRLRFVLAILIFSVIIIGSRYTGEKYTNTLQAIQALLTQTLL